MSRVSSAILFMQPLRAVCRLILVATSVTATLAATMSVPATSAAAAPPLTPKEAEAKTEAAMKPYAQQIPGTEAKFQMLPIRGGEFLMGSPKGEKDRKADEGPQHKVAVEPFWMGKYEVTWEEFDVWTFDLDLQKRKLTGVKPTPLDKNADAITRPTKPYTDMTFNMGHDGYPAICMTQLAAKVYCQWLSAKTGHFYRLPTEAEWEYACRAGTTTAYSFGDDPQKLDDYAWHYDNGDDTYHKIGRKKPNSWGLYDMHGNVSEWVLDQYVADFYGMFPTDKATKSPLAVPTELFPRTVRGGSWDDDPDALRSAVRRGSNKDWKVQDPQLPQSVWYHTDAPFIGFRLVRSLRNPTKDERKRYGFDVVIPKDARTKTRR
jgi:formylglycine-generating enzyme required for sulfatase activity